jgi:signal transduction histidine kinase
MDQIVKERDRLLQRVARVYGLSFTVIAFLCVSVPGSLPLPIYLSSIPLLAILGVALYRLGLSREPLWVFLVIASGVGIIVLLAFAPQTVSQSALSAIGQVGSAATAAIAIVLTTSTRRVAVLVAGFVVISGVTLASTASLRSPFITAGLLALGWTIPAVVGIWINASVPQAARRIASIGRAHRAERQASELEAQRRQGARLLHDTVLATLTLLAHSGLGVNADALREQAGDDAKLLRQLRLGATPTPLSYGGVGVKEPVEETVLGTTLQSVKQRFGRMGLDVSWHGTGQVLLPSDVLDAFLLALAECLENVRRHSGVKEAHVTIVDDETTVRAMITDAGVGFNLSDVDAARLGFKESVVGRLKEVGGHARLFSAPGSGTTVVLEVPR